MAPTLFIMMFSVMLTDAFKDSDAGFPILHRFDGNLFKFKFDSRQMCWTSSSMQLTWQRMPKRRQKCKGLWIEFHNHVTTMTLQSASSEKE